MTEKQFKPDTSVGYRHEVIPPDQPEYPYLDRRILGIGIPGRKAWFSLRLHHFFRSDEDHLHDHNGWFVTLVLRGSYTDWVGCPYCEFGYRRKQLGYWNGAPYVAKTACDVCRGTGQVVGDEMRPGSIKFRPSGHLHRVETKGCWTLVLFGPKRRDWGFVVDGKWMRQRRYFERFGGAAACREVEVPEDFNRRAEETR